MVSLTCTTSREGGVTLVTGRVENADRRRRVRLENRLDGPVWPPRRRGVPAAGWSDDGFECVLAAGETRALGYASPAPPTDPPLVVVETDPVDSETDDGFEPRVDVPSVDQSPDGVVRALGSSRPPRDAVPDPEPTLSGTGTDAQAQSAASAEATDETASPAVDSESPDSSAASAERQERPGVDAVEAWLDAVEERVDLADGLSETTRVSAAADALDRAGGLDGVRRIDDRLDRDADELRRVAERATALAERAETASFPVETIERVR